MAEFSYFLCLLQPWHGKRLQKNWNLRLLRLRDIGYGGSVASWASSTRHDANNQIVTAQVHGLPAAACMMAAWTVDGGGAIHSAQNRELQ